MTQTTEGKNDIWDLISEQLRKQCVDLKALLGKDLDPSQVKVVCIAPDLKDSLREIGEANRDQVVMVRIDESSSKALDAWIDTGAVKSRSEAAALFIREGLKVRSGELEQLNEALGDVEEARNRLRDKAREVLGNKS